MPVLAGPLSTGGGLVFIAGTTEGGLRAIHSRSGTELWAAGAATVDSPIAFALE